MTEAKHTSGPWYHEHSGHIVVDTRDQVCCGRPHSDGECCGNPEIVGDYFEVAKTSESDAHLIAAAPELFEALDQIVEAVARTTNGDVCQVSNFDFAREALAKARGEPC